MKKKFYFTPDAGKLNLEDESGFKSYIKKFRATRHVIEIKEYHEKRSLGCNAYMWAVIIHYFCVEYCGPPGGKSHDKATQQRMHDILGQRFRIFTDEKTGMDYVKGTSEMTGKEIWAYFDQCFQLYQEYFEGNIPTPHATGYLSREMTENDSRAT